MQLSSNLLCKLRVAWTICCLCRLVVACTAGKLQQHVRALMEFGRYMLYSAEDFAGTLLYKTKTQLCSLLQFLTTDKQWYPPVPEWKGLLLPASRGERPIIDGGRTPVSLVPRPRGRREKWPGIHCLRMRENPMISWGIVYHRLRTVSLYRIAPKHVRLELISRTAGQGENFHKALKFVLCCIGKVDFTLKAE